MITQNPQEKLRKMLTLQPPLMDLWDGEAVCENTYSDAAN